MKNISKEVIILSLAFSFVFFGYNGVQQYLTLYFSKLNLFKVGFYSLILIYLFFILFSFLSALFVKKYGFKKPLLIASLFYSIFIFSLLTKSIFLVYLASILLGISAAFLWMGQISCLVRETEKKFYGESSGFFNTFLSLGSGLGIFILGFLIEKLKDFETPFLFFAFFPLIGAFIFLKLKEKKPEKNLERIKFPKKLFLSKTSLQFSSLWFAQTFVFGITIGILPLQVEKALGVSFVGILSSLFLILPIIFSYLIGRLSDKIGREILIFVSYFFRLISFLFLSIPKTFYLMLGVFFLILGQIFSSPISFAIVGDVTDKKNLEFLNALFNAFSVSGVVLALSFSTLKSPKIIYLVSFLVTLISLFLILPLLKLGLEKVREKIIKEIGVLE